MLKRWLMILAVLGLLAGLGGCTTIRTDVTAFHQLDRPSGLTFAMVPFKEQQGSVEYSTYAQAVSNQLRRFGMVESDTVSNAAVAVFIRYGIDGGSQVTSSYPIMGQTGVLGSNTTGTVSRFGNMASVNATTTYTPTYGVVGTGVSTSTVYKRFLDVEMLEVVSLQSGTVKKLYEAKARSDGSSSQLSAVMPYMVESLFKEFPGTSGKARRHDLTFK